MKDIERFKAAAKRLQQRNAVIDVSVRAETVNASEAIVESYEQQAIKEVVTSMVNGQASDTAYKLTILQHLRTYYERQKKGDTE